MSALRHHTHNRANMYGLARHARHYERWAGVFAQPLYRRVVADVAAAALPPGATVLDLGTGPGTLPLLVAAQSPHLSVSGVDLSAEMIDRATAAADMRSTRGASPVSFQIADVAQLPFDDQSVDLVVSLSACTTGRTSPLGCVRSSECWLTEGVRGSTTSGGRRGGRRA